MSIKMELLCVCLQTSVNLWIASACARRTAQADARGTGGRALHLWREGEGGGRGKEGERERAREGKRGRRRERERVGCAGSQLLRQGGRRGGTGRRTSGLPAEEEDGIMQLPPAMEGPRTACPRSCVIADQG